MDFSMSISGIWSENLRNYHAEPSLHLRTKRLNLLIGPNNSGKSRLLRTLSSTTEPKLSVAISDLSEAAKGLGGRVLETINSFDRIGSLNCEKLRAIISGDCLPAETILETADELVTTISQAANSNISYSGNSSATQGFYQLRSDLRLEFSDTSAAALSLQKIVESATTYKRHYIPILRGMRPLNEHNDSYRERTLKDYFQNGSEPEIVTGYDLYNLLVQFLLGQPESRQRVREYEKLLGHEFFGGADVTLIPEYGKDTVSVKIGDDDQFPIYDLGDGMQQVIIITSAAFLEKNSSLFFIEEPESCLHPGLLRKLALFLLNHTEHHFFATTHSNHLLDLAETDDRILVHKVQKTGTQSQAKFIINECTRDRQLLADLGVLASSVYLANSTIWVEGITDRLYLKSIFNKYISTTTDPIRKVIYEGLIENFHYAFVEYQGGTLGHWSFDEELEVGEALSASNLCSSAFLVADGDILDKGQRAQILHEQLGMRFHMLKCKEIENLLPRNIIIKTAKQIFERKQNKTKEGLNINLIDNITQKISSSPHGIGYLLDKALGLAGKGKSNRRIFADESGTINGKVQFCREAIEIMNSTPWELSTDLTTLCENIFQHIVSINQLDLKASIYVEKNQHGT